MNMLIDFIKEEMSWYGFSLTDEQIKDYLKKTPLECFDTLERETYVDYLGKKLTGMSYPSNGDSDSYKENFYRTLHENSKNLGYIWGEE